MGVASLAAPCNDGVAGQATGLEDGGVDDGAQFLGRQGHIVIDQSSFATDLRIFQRLNARTEYEGTGIGLAIAKKIIDRHNGAITALSTPGHGSVFYLFLPVKQDQLHKSKEENQYTATRLF